VPQDGEHDARRWNVGIGDGDPDLVHSGLVRLPFGKPSAYWLFPQSAFPEPACRRGGGDQQDAECELRATHAAANVSASRSAATSALLTRR
jgi:hypothetical protein